MPTARENVDPSPRNTDAVPSGPSCSSTAEGREHGDLPPAPDDASFEEHRQPHFASFGTDIPCSANETVTPRGGLASKSRRDTKLEKLPARNGLVFGVTLSRAIRRTSSPTTPPSRRLTEALGSTAAPQPFHFSIRGRGLMSVLEVDVQERRQSRLM